jgi:PDZ domain-containing secreted protein/Zn-dependent protease/predicted transcriptional regulator
LESSFTFARIRGIPIGAHWSWLAVFGLVVWSLGTALFPRTYPGLPDGAYLVMGLVAGIIFFGSILLHELGHAVQAVKEDMVIEGITLWLFGGVARFRGMFPSAGAEFRIAIAGPLVSVAVAAFFGALTFVGTRVGWGSEIQGVVDYLWRINVLVVAFNLIPALPLDGGRVLRAWLWHRQENFVAATVAAARAGKAFGIVLIVVGLLNFFTADAGTGGLWFLFLGWFLIQAAQSESSAMQIRALLADRKVRDVMTGDPITAAPNQTVTEFLDGAIGASGHSMYPVVDDGRLVGITSLRRAGEVAQSERDLVPLERIMEPVGSVKVLDPDTPVLEVVEELQEGPRRAPVVDDGRLVGIVSLADLVRLLEIEKARGNGAPPKTKRSGVLVWIVVGVIMLLAGAYLYHPPLAVVSPGTALDVTDDIDISGVPEDDVNGEYVLTAVSIAQPNALGVAWAWLSPEKEVLSLASVVPEGVDEDEYFRQQREVFEQSEQLAAAAAARATGAEVTISGSGARVVDVLEGTPAATELRPGDVIVAIDGEPVELVTDLQRIVRRRPAGTAFDVKIERNGSERTVELESVQLPGGTEGAIGIGVVVSTRDFDIGLPFEIDFRRREIGGPSAGFVYSLAIADLLDQGDFARGRSIAATGTIDIEGGVGEIGHPHLKAIAAEEEGADVFLVPESQVDEVEGADIEVLGVDDLEQAIGLLEGAA